MNIVLKANIYHHDVERQLVKCLDYLLGKGVGVWVERQLERFTRGLPVKVLEEPSQLEDIALIIALGGDGTVLAATRLAGSFQIPVLGVNLGNFGFLTSCSLDDFTTVFERILNGDYNLEERMMLTAEVITAAGREDTFTALNEVVLHKGSLARPIMIELKAGNDLVGVFPCDGVIVTTPTGSTAYSLSAGGPILFPPMNAIAVTPICPHTLAVRPLVVPADIPVSLSELSSHDDVILTVDGQVSYNVREEDSILVTRAPHVTRLVKPFDGSFFFRLRSKLKWGERERK